MSASTDTPRSHRFVSGFPVYYGWIVWAVATIGFVASAPGQSFTVSLFFDFFIEDFELSRTLVSALYGGGTFLASLSLTLVGRLIDHQGNHRVSTGITLGLAIVLALFSLVTGPLTLFIGFMAIRGLGQGSMTLVNSTVIAEWFSRLRGRMMSITLVMFALFQAVYVPWLQNTLELYDWRQVWVMLGAGVAVLVLPLIALFIRNRPEDFGLLPDGDAQPDPDDLTPQQPLPAEVNWSLPEVMRTALFWCFVAARMLAPAWVTGLVIHQVSLFEGLGYDARVAAETYAAITLVSAASSILMGWMVDRLHPRLVLSILQLGLLSACGLATIMTSDALRGLYVLSMGLILGGGGVFDGAVWTNLFGRLHQGSIRGFITTALVAGSAAGPVIFGISYDSTGSYNLALWGGILLCTITLTGTLLVPMPRKQKRKSS